MLERFDARFGPGHALRVVPYADHRPEHMQIWAAAAADKNWIAIDSVAVRAIPSKAAAWNRQNSGALYPTWLLAAPLKLALRHKRPLYQGPLLLLAGPQRLEAAWWDADTAHGKEDTNAGQSQGAATLRDYFIARSELSGLLWIYRERAGRGEAAWYLHGLFA